MSKKRLSEQFREQLDSLGKSLAAHTRSLDDHFDNQEVAKVGILITYLIPAIDQNIRKLEVMLYVGG